MTRTRGKRTAAGGDGEGTPPTESRTVGGDGGLNILERLAAAAVPCADFVEAPLEASSLQAWRSSSFQALVSKVEAPLEVVERFLAVSFASSRILFASHCATRQVPLVAKAVFQRGIYKLAMEAARIHRRHFLFKPAAWRPR